MLVKFTCNALRKRLRWRRPICIKGVSLFQYRACPYCLRVRIALLGNRLEIENRYIETDPKARAELVHSGGKLQVPCLRIEENGRVRWLYESSAIIRYLEQRIKQ